MLGDYTIDLEPRKTPLYSSIYSIGDYKLKSLQRYLNDSLILERIRPSASLASAPIIFVLKKSSAKNYLYINY